MQRPPLNTNNFDEFRRDFDGNPNDIASNENAISKYYYKSRQKRL